MRARLSLNLLISCHCFLRQIKNACFHLQSKASRSCCVSAAELSCFNSLTHIADDRARNCHSSIIRCNPEMAWDFLGPASDSKGYASRFLPFMPVTVTRFGRFLTRVSPDTISQSEFRLGSRERHYNFRFNASFIFEHLKYTASQIAGRFLGSSAFTLPVALF